MTSTSITFSLQTETVPLVSTYLPIFVIWTVTPPFFFLLRYNSKYFFSVSVHVCLTFSARSIDDDVRGHQVARCSQHCRTSLRQSFISNTFVFCRFVLLCLLKSLGLW